MITLRCGFCNPGRHPTGGWRDGPWWNSFNDLDEYLSHMQNYHRIKVRVVLPREWVGE